MPGIRFKKPGSTVQVLDLDWTQLRKEYLLSTTDSPRQFLIGKLGEGFNPPHSRYKGWLEQKNDMKRREAQATAARHVASARKYNDELITTKREILDIVRSGITDLLQMAQDPAQRLLVINKASNIKTLYEIVKTELGEPTTVTQNNNNNVNITFDQFIQAIQAKKEDGPTTTYGDQV